MIRRPPRSTHCISSAASDVYKRQVVSTQSTWGKKELMQLALKNNRQGYPLRQRYQSHPVSYTHLRAHETRHDLVCRLLLEKKKKRTCVKKKEAQRKKFQSVSKIENI
eukprot:TRINITY_DN11964_c0_g1_i1.p2 TRINITY_DN11964_c0_g1~~TRINITY_DN11964_c0_g1_i1.p2  ORF type:complete len:108 (-),score=27.23 TRINITY_DN11964_c0_g1_i1:6-329(-)